jgi:hypothetical protein
MKAWQWLGYLGLIPFLLCLWIFDAYAKKELSHFSFNPQQAFIFYSVIILSFLAGTLWRKDTLKENYCAQIFSNVFCVYAFLCLLTPLYYALILLPIGYAALFLTEYALCTNREYAYSKLYCSMRLQLTIIVSLLHALAFISWY